jgi:beta-lactamase superfamily II metal-dependent hydrolase
MPHPVPYIAIIDVGHGNSTIIREDSHSIIVDCGARGAGLLNFLQREQIKNIKAVFLSHADHDHIGGLIALLSSGEFNISAIYLNSDSSKESALWNDITYELSKRSAKGEIEFRVGLTHKDKFALSHASLEVIGPSKFLAAKGVGNLDKKNREINSNSISASFKVAWDDKSIAYLAGDIDQIALDDLIDHEISLAAPLLVYPHHGGKSDTSDEISFTKRLYELTKAATIIFSIGRNKHDNPRPEVVKLLREYGGKVRIACTQLSKNCANDLPSIAPRHLTNLFSKGRIKNECCSGTFVIQLGDKIEYLPDFKSHQSFIIASAPTSMCVENVREQQRVD